MAVITTPPITFISIVQSSYLLVVHVLQSELGVAGRGRQWATIHFFRFGLNSMPIQKKSFKFP